MWQPETPVGGFRFFAEYSAAMRRFNLFMTQEAGYGLDQTYIPEPIKMVKREDDGGSQIEPLIQLDQSAAQALMDALWNTGLRPASRGSVSEIVAAKDAHLVDMRSILNRLTGTLNPGTEG